jgi:hypothetical protein
MGGDTLGSNVVYDVFAKGSSSTAFSLEFAKWASDTARYSAWATATGYKVGQRVSNGSNYYACIQAHTSSATDEPGVGTSWQDYWLDLGTDSRCLYQQDGVLVYGPNASGATAFDGREYRFLGMVRLVDNAGTAEFRDQKNQRFIMNHYNKLQKELGVDNPYSGSTSETVGTSFVPWMGGDFKTEWIADGEHAITLTANGPYTVLNSNWGTVSFKTDGTSGIDDNAPSLGQYHYGVCNATYTLNAQEGYHYIHPMVRVGVAGATVHYWLHASTVWIEADVQGTIRC